MMEQNTIVVGSDTIVVGSDTIVRMAGSVLL